MKFEVTDTPVYENGERWQKAYLALLKAHKSKKSLRVFCEGKHHGSIVNAMRYRLKQDKKNVKRIVIGSMRDQDRDAVVFTVHRIDKNGRTIY